MMQNRHALLLIFLIAFSCISCSKKSELIEARFEKVSETQDPEISYYYDKREKSWLKTRKIPIRNKQDAIAVSEKVISLINYQFRFIPFVFSAKEFGTIKCEQESRPLENRLKKGKLITSLADERFAICICQQNKTVYNRGTSFLYDLKSSSVLVVDYFLPIGLPKKNLIVFFERDLKDYEIVDFN